MSATPSLGKRFIAELFGTFFLVFLGTMSITAPGSPTELSIGLAFGIGALGAVYSFGHVSGAHINPAVTFALAVRGKFPWKEVVPYILAQLIGAIFAALLNASILGERLVVQAKLGATYPNSNLSGYVDPVLAALMCEIAITFLLVLTILSVTEKEAPSGFAGLAIGLILGMNVMIAANISGGSMNPARTFGPQLVLLLFGEPLASVFESAWVYWIGPLFGGSLAALVHGVKS